MTHKVDEFKANQAYTVLQDWSESVEPFFRTEHIRHELKKGERVRFKCPNMGYAVFYDSEGRVIYLKPRVAFRIVGLCVSSI